MALPSHPSLLRDSSSTMAIARFEALCKRWHWAKSFEFCMRQEITQCKAHMDKFLQNQNINQLATDKYEVCKAIQKRVTIRKDDVPTHIWRKYASKYTFTVLTLKILTRNLNKGKTKAAIKIKCKSKVSSKIGPRHAARLCIHSTARTKELYFESLCKRWDWARSEEVSMKKIIEECKKSVEEFLHNKGVNEFSTDKYKVKKMTSSSGAIGKKDVSKKIWCTYAKESTFTRWSMQPLAGRRDRKKSQQTTKTKSKTKVQCVHRPRPSMRRYRCMQKISQKDRLKQHVDGQNTAYRKRAATSIIGSIRKASIEKDPCMRTAHVGIGTSRRWVYPTCKVTQIKEQPKTKPYGYHNKAHEVTMTSTNTSITTTKKSPKVWNRRGTYLSATCL